MSLVLATGAGLNRPSYALSNAPFRKALANLEEGKTLVVHLECGHEKAIENPNYRASGEMIPRRGCYCMECHRLDMDASFDGCLPDPEGTDGAP